ncbi:OPT superfamily oligopeptide transporter [Neoconidiobolus thromboides FSU 785]|nr:OPT superfamily oligopeptide transporter [Neoconidiobolus thromboides FSU 785]
MENKTNDLNDEKLYEINPIFVKNILDYNDNQILNEGDDNPIEFTWRASILGSFLGCIIATSNMYLGLKSGWTFAASIFGAILGYGILKPWSKLPTYLGGGGEFGIKENCTIQTAAVAAGGLFAGYVSGIPAMFRLNLLPPLNECWSMFFLWTLAAAFYGMFFAVPLRHYYIISQKLIFPSPTAAANTIISLHSKKDRTAATKTKWLLSSFIISILYKITGYFIPTIIDLHILYWFSLTNIDNNVSQTLSTIDLVWKWHFQVTTAFFGAGMMVGLNTAISFFVGDILAWGIIGPYLFYDQGDQVLKNKPWGFKDNGATVQTWNLWVGIVILLCSSFTELFMQYKSLLSAVKSGIIQLNNLLAKVIPIKKRIFNGSDNIDPVPIEGQVPIWMWVTGTLASLLLTVLVLKFYFEMSIPAGILAALLGFLFSFIGCQTAGETDINPTGVIGKASQFCFAGIPAPSLNILRLNNLIAGSVASACSQQTVDMVGDLKTGYLLNVSPRSQFYAQIVGSVFGVVIAVVLFMLFATAYPCILDINSSTETCEFPVPGAAAWTGVTIALTKNINDIIPLSCKIACLIFAIVTIVSTVLKNTLLKNYRAYMPNWNSIGLAFVNSTPCLPVSNLLGAIIGFIWNKYNPNLWGIAGIPLASGLIAGEGIGGLFHAIFNLIGLSQDEYAIKFACPNNKC